MRIPTPAVLLLAFLISCQPKKPSGGLDQTITIDLAEPVEKQGPAEAWIEDLQFIPLETNPECFISSTNKYNLDQDHIVLASDGTVHLFDREGRHLKSFKKQGKGPGEYGMIYSIDLIPGQEEIMVVDPNQRKILCYDYSGNLTGEIHPAFMPTKVAPLTGGLFACYIGRLSGFWDDNRELFQVVFLNREGQIVSKYLPFKYTMQSVTGGDFSNSGVEGTCLINPAYEYNIYQVGPGNQFFIKYRFDFGNYNIDTSLLNDERIQTNKQSSRIFGEKKTCLDHMTSTSNIISFWGPVVQTNMRFGTRQISRKSGHVRFMEVDTLNTFGYFAGIPIEFNTESKASGVYFTFYKDAVDILEIFNKLKPGQKKVLSRFKGFDRLAKLKEDDNPLLILYKVKDF